MIKLDVGSGIIKQEGFIRIDLDPKTNPDYVLNIEKEKLPFEENSVDEIFASHILEHLHDLDFFMQEAYRVLKPNGILTIFVPYAMHVNAFSDPTHVRFFTEATMVFYDRRTISSDGRRNIKENIDFFIDEIELIPCRFALNEFPRAFDEFNKKHSNNMYETVKTVMHAVKPAREKEEDFK